MFSGYAQVCFCAAGDARIAPIINCWHEEFLVQTGCYVVGVGGDATGDIMFYAQLSNTGNSRLDFRMIARQAHADREIRRSYKYRAHARGRNYGLCVFMVYFFFLLTATCCHSCKVL